MCWWARNLGIEQRTLLRRRAMLKSVKISSGATTDKTHFIIFIFIFCGWIFLFSSTKISYTRLCMSVCCIHAFFSLRLFLISVCLSLILLRFAFVIRFSYWHRKSEELLNSFRKKVFRMSPNECRCFISSQFLFSVTFSTYSPYIQFYLFNGTHKKRSHKNEGKTAS